MTQQIRFLFDECLSRPVVETQIVGSLALYGADATVTHFLSRYPRGVKDRVWIPQVAEEGGWIVVSMDRGRSSRMSERLPLICQAFRVTHVMLSAGLDKRNMYYRARAIGDCWPELIAAGAAPAGTGFVLSMRESRSGVTFRLRKKTDALAPEDVPLVQQALLKEWSERQ